MIAAPPSSPRARRLITTLGPFVAWLLFGLLAAAPLWGPGIVNTRGGGDSPFLLQRTMDMAESLAHGIFPVSDHYHRHIVARSGYYSRRCSPGYYIGR